MKETKLVKVYYKPSCPYSLKALSLLNTKKGIKLEKTDITDNDTLKKQMIQESSRFTVPQIFIGSKHVGGYDDLLLLERSSQLDQLLYE